eukprot:SAG11_NODE_770_length_7257_cov_2.448449_11_plen_76_part_00
MGELHAPKGAPTAQLRDRLQAEDVGAAQISEEYVFGLTWETKDANAVSLSQWSPPRFLRCSLVCNRCLANSVQQG